jgi:division protein CdvB (Snf7/Vps24/ESCRT-III family)
MTSFDKNWGNNHNRGASTSDKLKETLQPQTPLKPRIETAVNKIQLQTSKLDTMITKLNERDASLFRRVVDSMQRHDVDTAKILSNELAEVRKILHTLAQAKMALDQVSLRLSTIHDLGDTMVALGPAISCIKSLKPSLGRFVPGADNEISSMQSLLSGIMMESLQSNGIGIEINNTGGGGDIEQIMMEASAVAEEKVHDKFPSIPGGSFRISDTESHQQ